MKKILIYIITFIFIFSISYQVNASTNTFERNKENKYGVNKKWKITSSNLDKVKNTHLVNSDEKIYDYADILTEDEELELYTYISNYIEETNFDMVILTINTPYSYDKKNEEIAADFYDYNDFGINFDNYSGVLLLRNAWERDPYYNVYMFGDSQLYYDFNRSEHMLDLIYDDFVSHNYLSGYKKFIDSYTNYYKKGIPSSRKHYYIDKMGYLKKQYTPPIIIASIISLMVSGIIILIMISKNKMVRHRTNAKEYLNKSSIKYTNKTNQLVNSYTTTHVISTSSSSGGGGGSHSGSSGGGHSSGGGRHG